MTRPTYASREQFMAAYDIAPSPARNEQVDRILQAASRKIEGRHHRTFYPTTEAKTFTLASGGEGFWLNTDLLSITAVTEDGVSATISDIDLYPTPDGPPYSWISASGSTVVVTGDWGYSNDEVAAGALAEALDSSETAVDVSDSSKIGVGDVLICDSERMIVTGKSQLDTGTDLTASLNADKSDTTVAVDDGTAVNVGEYLLIDSEKVLVTDIAGNNLTVLRAQQGTTLAAHSTVSVYAPRTLTVERGALGSTAATHTDTTAISRNYPPPEITALCIAEGMVLAEQEGAAYALVIGEGEGQREASGKGLKGIREDSNHLVRLRMGAI